MVKGSIRATNVVGIFLLFLLKITLYVKSPNVPAIISYECFAKRELAQIAKKLCKSLKLLFFHVASVLHSGNM